MADSGNATVFESIACQSIQTGAGTLLSTPATNADDLVILGGTTGGITILSSTAGNIRFGDAADSDVGRLTFDHSNNYITMGAGGTSFYFNLVDINIQTPNAADTTPTLLAGYTSGAIFISGGGLWYKGFAGTYTEVAVA